jgi:type II secretory pathway component GspD/PulD (secretin)
MIWRAYSVLFFLFEETTMSRCLLACALFLLVSVAACAEDRPAAERKRGAYFMKHTTAKSLAEILAKHFKGTADIQAGPEGTSNFILVNAPPAVFDEVMKTIEQVDRRPHSVVVVVYVVKAAAKKPDDKGKGLEEKDLSGAIDDVSKRLDAMMRKGQIASLERIQITTLQGQVGSLMQGENKPYVTGVVMSRTGVAAKSVTYRNLGTRVKVTPQVAADRSVSLNVSIEDTRSRDSATATVGKDEKGNPIPATEFIQTSFAGIIRVASGKAALAKDVKVSSKDGEGESFIVVGASIVDEAPKDRKK